MTSPGSVFSAWPSFIPKWDLDRSGTQGRLSTMYVSLDDIDFDSWLDMVPPEGLLYARALGVGYFRFVLDSATVQSSEKAQIMPLVGDTFAGTFFGAMPTQLNVQGFLYNTKFDQWWDAFSFMYSFLLRAGRSAASKSKISIVIDSRRYTGVILSMQESISAADQTRVTFNFSMTVTSSEWTASAEVANQLSGGGVPGSVVNVVDVQDVASQQLTDPGNEIVGIVGRPRFDPASSMVRAGRAVQAEILAPLGAAAEKQWVLASAELERTWPTARAYLIDGAQRTAAATQDLAGDAGTSLTEAYERFRRIDLGAQDDTYQTDVVGTFQPSAAFSLDGATVVSRTNTQTTVVAPPPFDASYVAGQPTPVQYPYNPMPFAPQATPPRTTTTTGYGDYGDPTVTGTALGPESVAPDVASALQQAKQNTRMRISTPTRKHAPIPLGDEDIAAAVNYLFSSPTSSPRTVNAPTAATTSIVPVVPADQRTNAAIALDAPLIPMVPR